MKAVILRDQFVSPSTNVTCVTYRYSPCPRFKGTTRARHARPIIVGGQEVDGGEDRALVAQLDDGLYSVVRFAILAGVVAVLLTMAPAQAWAVFGLRTVRVSGTALSASNADSFWGSASSDVRYVAFQSAATNLAAGGGTGTDVFVRDTRSTAIRCVSTAPNGAVPNGASAAPSISGNGQLVAFASNASNLVAGDTNGTWDVFCRSVSGTSAVAVGVSSLGVLGNGDSSEPALSANGRRVAFVSSASNLVEGDSAGYDDIFVRDMVTGTTVRVSLGLSGAEANGNSSAPAISADGRKVAFASRASNLVAGDTNGASDIFVVDVNTLALARVSVRGSATQANLGSYAPSISGDGRKVAFESLATNLVSGDRNDVRDVFVRGLVDRMTVRASVSSSGKQGNAESREPSLSYYGSAVAFSSTASNLVSRDKNARADVFVGVLGTRRTTRISMAPSAQANASCGGAVLSSDGRRAVYQSTASNLVTKDGNGRSDVFMAAWGRRVYDRVQAGSVYGTAVQASKRCAPNGAYSVVVVNGTDWRSAIAGASLAGAARGPLLYVGMTWLPAETKAEIVRLGAKRVYVVGGTSAVSDGVVSGLASIVGRAGVERVGSGDAYAVGATVASRVVSLKGSGFNGTVLVASGASHRASIGGVALAAGSGYPVVFVNTSTGAYRLPAGTKRAIILGGTGSVSRTVESRLKRKLGKSRVSRLAGSGTYTTAVVVGKRSVKLRHTWDGVTVVNPAKPTEAICGAVMAGRVGSVVLCTRRGSLPKTTRLRLTASRHRIDSVHIFGPTSSIGSSVSGAVKKALGG